ncbi:MAG: recombinase family protein, partial [Phycisphaerae bacterium]
ELKDIGYRVRRQQELIAEDVDGCVGDYPYGYTSEYVDPTAAANYHGRGPKPRKRVILDRAAAAVVRLVFYLYAIRGWSIAKIVRHLQALGAKVPPIRSKKWHGWHHTHVRRMLANHKYVGLWPFGGTTTVRDGDGRKKQIPHTPQQRASLTERPHLRLIPELTWQKAQAQLAKLEEIFGQKEGQLRRGTPVHYTVLYPKRILNGLVYCAACNERLHAGGSGKKKHLYCPQHRKGLCRMSQTVPQAKAETAVVGVLSQILTQYPPWVAAVLTQMNQAIEATRQQVPAELEAKRTMLAKTMQEQENVLRAIRSGMVSAALAAELAKCEKTVKELQADVAAAQQTLVETIPLPDETWVREKLKDLAGLLQTQMPKSALIMRSLLGKIMAHPVTYPGKQRGHIELRFQVQGLATVLAALGERVPPLVRQMMGSAGEDMASEAQEFVVPLGEPTNMDRHGPTVVAMRQAGAKWKDIAAATGINLQNAYTLYKRLMKASAPDNVMPPKEPPATA